MRVVDRNVPPLYLIDPESGAELARLYDQHKLFTEHLGLFPPETVQARIERVLDLGCGPGEWVQEAALANQDMVVEGIDNCPAAVQYARALARVRHLSNAVFREMDLCRPLGFPDDSFDLIQATDLATSLQPGVWPALLAECRRLLRPGGFIRIVEAEWPDTNSPAAQQIGCIMVRGLERMGRRYHPDGHRLGALEVIRKLLGESGFTQVRCRRVEVPFTVDLVGRHPIMDQVLKTTYLMEPSLLSWGAVETKQQYDALVAQMEYEAIDQDFQGTLCIEEVLGVLE
jgi:SAM-dependent methyltransferase